MSVSRVRSHPPRPGLDSRRIDTSGCRDSTPPDRTKQSNRRRRGTARSAALHHAGVRKSQPRASVVTPPERSDARREPRAWRRQTFFHGSQRPGAFRASTEPSGLRKARRRRPTSPGALQHRSSRTPDVNVRHRPGRCSIAAPEHPTSTSDIAPGDAASLLRDTRHRRPTSPGALQHRSSRTPDVDVRHRPGRCCIAPPRHPTLTSGIAPGRCSIAAPENTTSTSDIAPGLQQDRSFRAPPPGCEFRIRRAVS